jgi:hypothetical protein
MFGRILGNGSVKGKGQAMMPFGNSEPSPPRRLLSVRAEEGQPKDIKRREIVRYANAPGKFGAARRPDLGRGITNLVPLLRAAIVLA